ncbi:Crp/Fnr family transcriptional regulator [Aureimonas populi]|uniref:Crp/Fnr family transcriptional regulator n=1 Tax=Aureimonas populi TaxID=1701758 RepID=A0ABW5CKH1_9HYPH|nr:Crp/Fnr family transcriptional regulator [Aureimonas populi]
MAATIIAKLTALHPLPEEDKALLKSVVGAGRLLPASSDVVREGDRSQVVHVIIEGQAYRYKLLPDGRRQIIGYLVPGDFCDLFGFLLKRMDHSIAARTPCRVAHLTEEDILVLQKRPMLARALWWSSLVDGAILREWLVNVGRRTADKRVAHILCELLMRLQVVGHAGPNSFRLSLSQTELADTVGLTTVSVNRAFQRLRQTGLISQTSRDITIPDVSALMDYAEFDATYLHFREPNDTRPDDRSANRDETTARAGPET